MQSLARMFYPPQCVSCGALVDSDFQLCGSCWKDTPFITGLVCDQCGTPLPGQSLDRPEFCDDCLTTARGWHQGRATLIYRANAKRLVLSLKHGDRLDLVKPTARWMAESASAIVKPDTLIVPIPAHWSRLITRRYNQAAVLANGVARNLAIKSIPDALIRSRRTAIQEGMGRTERLANMHGAIHPNPRRAAYLKGRDILLVDDVMTSGATFGVATDACYAADANRVSILALARVAKDT